MALFFFPNILYRFKESLECFLSKFSTMDSPYTCTSFPAKWMLSVHNSVCWGMRNGNFYQDRPVWSLKNCLMFMNTTGGMSLHLSGHCILVLKVLSRSTLPLSGVSATVILRPGRFYIVIGYVASIMYNNIKVCFNVILYVLWNSRVIKWRALALKSFCGRLIRQPAMMSSPYRPAGQPAVRNFFKGITRLLSSCSRLR